MNNTRFEGSTGIVDIYEGMQSLGNYAEGFREEGNIYKIYSPAVLRAFFFNTACFSALNKMFYKLVLHNIVKNLWILFYFFKFYLSLMYKINVAQEEDQIYVFTQQQQKTFIN